MDFMMKPYSRFFLILVAFFAVKPAFSGTLTLEDYLSQVDGKNQNVISAKQTSEGSGLSVKEAELMYAPVLFAQTEWDDNYFRNATFPEAYRSFFEDNYEIGVKELLPYGANISVSYLLSHQGYLQAVDFVSGQVSDRKFWEGTPEVQATISLWRNWMGSETKATEEVTRASALVTEYSSSYQVKTTRADAENAYVRLVSAQQLVKVYDDSLENANDVLRWNDRRMKVNLGESSDLMQAQANVESSQLLLQQSKDDLRVAARDFNRLRNRDSDQLDEDLILPSIENVQVPPRAELRDDVRAAQESAKLVAAQARLGEERNRPTLEAYGSFAANDRELEPAETFNGSFSLGQQTTAFGLRFQMPLAFGTRTDTVKGFAVQREASEALVVQKRFEQEVEWTGLTEQLTEAKRRYDIAVKLSAIQKRKVENERVRLKRGRTTTYQTLIFNIDFNSAEAARIQAQGQVLAILAKLRTFGDSRL
jgi:outer membrane protein TolC